MTVLAAGQSTPAPWINVISNPVFGFQVAVEGAGYTWSVNSRENQLTPWSNDPASDRPGEVHLCAGRGHRRAVDADGLANRRRSAANTPRVTARDTAASSATRTASRLNCCSTSRLPTPIKISRLKIRNASKRTRRLSITAYAEWVLGPSPRSASAPYLISELDSETGAIFATNPWNTMFKGRVAFADLGGRQSHWTCDRREFLGRHGTLEHPAALARAEGLAEQSGAGLDPCAALQRSISIEPEQELEVQWFLGEADDQAAARAAHRALSRRKSRCGAARGHGLLGWRVGYGAGENPAARDGPHAQSLDALSGAGVPSCGHGLRSTRRAAPMAFAISCRMRWLS